MPRMILFMPARDAGAGQISRDDIERIEGIRRNLDRKGFAPSRVYASPREAAGRVALALASRKSEKCQLLDGRMPLADMRTHPEADAFLRRLSALGENTDTLVVGENGTSILLGMRYLEWTGVGIDWQTSMRQIEHGPQRNNVLFVNQDMPEFIEPL